MHSFLNQVAGHPIFVTLSHPHHSKCSARGGSRAWDENPPDNNDYWPRALEQHNWKLCWPWCSSSRWASLRCILWSAASINTFKLNRKQLRFNRPRSSSQSYWEGPGRIPEWLPKHLQKESRLVPNYLWGCGRPTFLLPYSPPSESWRGNWNNVWCNKRVTPLLHTCDWIEWWQNMWQDKAHSQDKTKQRGLPQSIWCAIWEWCVQLFTFCVSHFHCSVHPWPFLLQGDFRHGTAT